MGPAAAAGTVSRVVRLVTLLAAVNIAASLLIRVWYRGSLFPGWDVIGVAEGVRLLATLTPAELWAHYRRFHGDPSWWWNIYGAPVTLLPAVLTNLHPWLYWAHVCTFLCTAIAAALVARALPPGGPAVAFVALGASPALLSWSIAGFPYISCVWPYALALWGVLRVKRLVPSLLIAILASELSWHGQELGRTVFLVYALAALGAVPARWYVRLAWAAVAGAQAALTVLHPSSNTARWSARPTLEHLVGVIPAVVREFVSGPFFGLPPELPIIPALAVVALLLVRTNPWLWRALLAAHAGLLVWLVANSTIGAGALWPRRVLLLEFLAVLAIAVAAADRPRWRPAFLAVLLVGNAWQLRETLAWARSPESRHAEELWALPYTQAELDYRVPAFVTRWTDEIMADIEAGRRVIVVYNLGAYWENSTDPAGIPERLYVMLGHERFMETVFMFGSETLRQHIFPVRPLAEIDGVLDGITDPGEFVVHSMSAGADPPSTVSEINTILLALQRRFRLVPAPAGQSPSERVIWYRWTLAPRPG